MANDEGGLLNQAEIEALFGAIGESGAVPASKPAGPPRSSPAPARAASASGVSPAPSRFDPTGGGEFTVQPYSLDEIPGSSAVLADASDISLIYDVDLEVRVELGRSRMYIEEVLRLKEGSIVPLDRLAGDPVDIYVNGRLLARGEVLVLNDNFCVRISEVIGEGSKALKGLPED